MNSTPVSPRGSRSHAHTGSLHELIGSLQQLLTTSSIMTPWPQVDSVTAQANSAEVRDRAKALMDQHQYSGIPVVWEGKVGGVFTRHDLSRPPRFENIRPEHFVPSDLGLIELIRHMQTHEHIVVGVGSSDEPLGWVTYADFSKRPFRVLLFAIVAEIEYLLAEALDRAHPDGSWIDSLESDPGRPNARAALLERREDAKHWDVSMPVTTFAEIGHLISGLKGSPQALARIGESKDVVERLQSIPELRNRVAHAVKPVVAGPSQIKTVCGHIDLLLGWIDSWTAQLSSTPSGGSDRG